MVNLEQYFTPDWMVDLYFAHIYPAAVVTLDPSAGDGAFFRGWQRHGTRTTLFLQSDIDPQMQGDTADFLSRDYVAPGRVDCIVTNPPFSKAREFAERGRKISQFTTLLVRQSFLSTQRRGEWLKENRPLCVHLVTQRPSFRLSARQKDWIREVKGKDPEEWGSDNAEYCYVSWLHESQEVEETTLWWL